MSKQKALAIISAVTITLFTITIVTLGAMAKQDDKGYDTVIEEHQAATSTTTEISLEDRRSKLMSKCRIQSKLSLDALAKLNQEILDAEDEEIKKYSLCIFQGMGILDDEGGLTLDPNTVKQWIPGTTDEILVVLSEKCVNIDGKTPEDYAIFLMKCIFDIGKN